MTLVNVRAQILITIGVIAATSATAIGARWQTYTATAYSVGGTTASGKPARHDKTVAADPDVLPIGTRIQVRHAGAYSGSYVVEDAGRKIAGRKIDIFIPSAAAAKRFGKKTVQVRVLKKATVEKTASAKLK